MPFPLFRACRRLDPLRSAPRPSSRARAACALTASFHKFPLYLPQSLQNERRLCRSNFARNAGTARCPKGTLRIYTAIGSPLFLRLLARRAVGSAPSPSAVPSVRTRTRRASPRLFRRPSSRAFPLPASLRAISSAQKKEPRALAVALSASVPSACKSVGRSFHYASAAAGRRKPDKDFGHCRKGLISERNCTTCTLAFSPYPRLSPLFAALWLEIVLAP